MSEPLLAVEDLSVEFRTRDGVARAVNGVSFRLAAGQALAILGESGSGKSVTAQAIMGILDNPPARITGGSIRLAGHELVGLAESQYRAIRGQRMSMIFQDALSALNPVVPVGDQIAQMYRAHQGLDRRAARDAAFGVMQRVRIPAAAQRYRDFPHQFSGGMRQRVMIAMMIALRPEVLIADEPTTALDVTVQAQIMDLIAGLRAETAMGLILITHDLGLVADVADEVVVMYAGRTMECGPVDQIYSRSANPYTRGLLASIPTMDRRGERLPAIPGVPPSPYRLPAGCAFHPRCPMATPKCRAGDPPPLVEVAPGHLSRCWYAEEVLAHGTG